MLTIYGVPLSVHTRKAIVTAILKGIDYKFKPVVPVIPGNPPANWSELSPTGKIPAITDGDFTLADSTAISLYLEKKQPIPSILPTDAKQLGRAMWFDAYAGGTIFRDVVGPLFGRVVVDPNIRKIPTDKAAVDHILTEVAPKLFAYLEGEIGGKFLVGNSLTIADIAIASNFLIFQYIGFKVDTARYPKLAAYLREIVRVEAFQKALEAEKPFAEQFGFSRQFLEAA